MQIETLAISLALALAAVAASLVTGRLSIGAPLGLGLVLGSANGFTVKSMIDKRAPILPTSFLRLAVFTLSALLIARLTGWEVWPVVAGIAVTQIVMFAVGTRRGLRS